MEPLPYIDEHRVTVDASPEVVWRALGEAVSRSFGSRAEPVTRLLGARHHASAGDPLTAGATVPGFRVARAEPARELALEGSHRFSRYALVFRIDALGPERSRLRAETRAVFPGPHGRVYRALVIGTRGHVLAVRRMLAGVRRRAEQDAAGHRPG